MNRAVRAEWTKFRTVPSTAWTLVSVVVCTVAVSSLAMLSLSQEENADTTRISLGGVYLGQIAVVVLAVLALTPEYETLMIRTTFAADPRRLRVLAAKALVLTAIVLAGGVLSTLGSLLASRMILPTNLPLEDGATWRAYAGTVLYLELIALLSLGIGAIVRHTGATITVVASLLYPLPIVAAVVTDPVWRDRLLRVMPMSAGLSIQATRNLDALPIAPWGGLGVLTAWAGAAAVLGTVLFHRRDTN